MRSLGQHWGPHGDFVWWGQFSEIQTGGSDFGKLVRLQFLEEIEDPSNDDRPITDDEFDLLLRFLRIYPF
jgi:hypothetical protein